MRVLITGGTSYLGQHMVPFFSKTDHEISYTWRNTSIDYENDIKAYRLDVRDYDTLSRFFDQQQFDVVIHLAASNRSENEESMVSSIIEGAENLTQLCQKNHQRLIHMSTDVVFDGTQAPYKESDPTNPIHAYGRAKAAAENIVLSYRNSVVVRPSLIYGLKVKDRSTEWIEKALKNGEPVTLFTDQIRMPVWVDTLSAACLELLDHSYTGIMNVVGRQVMSRAEFGSKMLDFWDIKQKETLRLDKSPLYSNWPVDLRLNTKLASEILKTPLLGVDEVLRNSAKA